MKSPARSRGNSICNSHRKSEKSNSLSKRSQQKSQRKCASVPRISSTFTNNISKDPVMIG